MSIPPSFDLVDQAPNALPLFRQFHITETSYKTITTGPNIHEIKATIFTPSNASSGPRPVLIKIHGGALTEGNRQSWMRPWIKQLALRHNAILVSPDYRLRPEASWDEIISDLRDFWGWVEDGLSKHLLEISGGNLKVDLGDVAIVGESAGGYMCAQSILLGLPRKRTRVRVAMLQYPLVDTLDFLAHHASQRYSEAERVDVKVLEKHLAGLIDETRVVSSVPYQSRMDLAMSMIQNGGFLDLEGENAYLDPMVAVEDGKDLPPVMLVHSRKDELVPIEGSYRFISKLKRLHPEVPVFFEETTGSHVFDEDHDMSQPWLNKAMEFVEKYWPVPLA